ncbi:MAG: substrate-binding domain-containing protein [Lactobacillus sp.]|nr:substrate-binding domain-containing protein [Lactobacillus sp.]
MGFFYFAIMMQSSKKQEKIGVSYMTMNNSFYQVLNEEVEKRVDARANKLIIRDPALNAQKQVDQINFFIKKKVAAIIINPVDGNDPSLIAVINKAHRKGIKIVVVDSQVSAKAHVDSTLLSDNYQAGVLCAQALMKKRKSAKILLLEHYSAMSANDRIRGFLGALTHKYQVVGRLNTWGQSEIAYPAVLKRIKQKVNFDTIMSLNDQAAVGAIAALDNCKVKNVDVYSVDGSANMKQLILSNPHATATAAQSPKQMGKLSYQVARNLIDGKKVKSRINLPVYLISKQNVKNYNVTGWQ